MDIILSFFKRPLYIVLPALLIIIFSVLLFVMRPLTTKSKLFIFPNNQFTYVDIEQRSIPQTGDFQKNITAYIKELPSGSRNIEMESFINERTVINTVIVNNGILTIDFSKEMNDFENQIPIPISEIIDLLEKNIKLNYKGIDKIVITIDGQTPGAPFYSLE